MWGSGSAWPDCEICDFKLVLDTTIVASGQGSENMAGRVEVSLVDQRVRSFLGPGLVVDQFHFPSAGELGFRMFSDHQ